MKIPKKHLPKIFYCPKCGKQAVGVRVRTHYVVVRCSSCELEQQLDRKGAYQPIDYYNIFMDRYEGPRATPIIAPEEASSSPRLSEMGSKPVISVLSKELLQINCRKEQERICSFISEYMKSSGSSGLVVGLSGGLDSSVALGIASKLMGGERLTALFIVTDEESCVEGLTDAEGVAALFGVGLEIVNISEALRRLQASLSNFDAEDMLSLGNLKARLRMSVLYYYANRLGRLVLGTGDKSELLLGYFTKYGDGGVDILPLGHLYKTQVMQLARHLSIPERVVNKPPSPNLWPGQTAERELGMNYGSIDLILLGLEQGIRMEAIARETRLPIDQVTSIAERVSKNQHKRRPTPTPADWS